MISRDAVALRFATVTPPLRYGGTGGHRPASARLAARQNFLPLRGRCGRWRGAGQHGSKASAEAGAQKFFRAIAPDSACPGRRGRRLPSARAARTPLRGRRRGLGGQPRPPARLPLTGPPPRGRGGPRWCAALAGRPALRAAPGRGPPGAASRLPLRAGLAAVLPRYCGQGVPPCQGRPEGGSGARPGGPCLMREPMRFCGHGNL